MFIVLCLVYMYCMSIACTVYCMSIVCICVYIYYHELAWLSSLFACQAELPTIRCVFVMLPSLSMGLGANVCTCVNTKGLESMKKKPFASLYNPSKSSKYNRIFVRCLCANVCLSQELAHWNPLSSKHACLWPEWLQSHDLIWCLQNQCLQKGKAFSLDSLFSLPPSYKWMAFLSDPRSFWNSSSLLHTSRSEMVFLFRFMDVMAGCVSKCARNFENKFYVLKIRPSQKSNDLYCAKAEPKTARIRMVLYLTNSTWSNPLQCTLWESLSAQALVSKQVATRFVTHGRSQASKPVL